MKNADTPMTQHQINTTALPCSAAILAGGLSSRFNGQPKGLIQIDGQPIVQRLHDRLKPIFQELIIVTNQPLDYMGIDCHIVTDLFDQRSSLTGIHAALFHATCPHVFLTACDTPFLSIRVVQLLLAHISMNHDVIMPATSAGLEPLCAVYRKSCLHTVQMRIIKKRFKIQNVFRAHRILKVSEKKLRDADPQLRSFFNINTPADLDRALLQIGDFNGSKQNAHPD